jgi:hypothetical protein
MSEFEDKRYVVTGAVQRGSRQIRSRPTPTTSPRKSPRSINVAVAGGTVGWMPHHAVLPGRVNTPILTDFEETMGRDVLDGLKMLLGRHAEPDDIAKVILFLAFNDSAWINGHAVIVDGSVTGAMLSGVIPIPEIYREATVPHPRNTHCRSRSIQQPSYLISAASSAVAARSHSGGASISSGSRTAARGSGTRHRQGAR